MEGTQMKEWNLQVDFTLALRVRPSLKLLAHICCFRLEHPSRHMSRKLDDGRVVARAARRERLEQFGKQPVKKQSFATSSGQTKHAYSRAHILPPPNCSSHK